MPQQSIIEDLTVKPDAIASRFRNDALAIDALEIIAAIRLLVAIAVDRLTSAFNFLVTRLTDAFPFDPFPILTAAEENWHERILQITIYSKDLYQKNPISNC